MIKPLSLAAMLAAACLPAAAATVSGSPGVVVDASGTSVSADFFAADFVPGGVVSAVTITLDHDKCNTISSGICNTGSFEYQREIRFALTSPSGTTVNLVNYNTYSVNVPGGNRIVTFDDSAGDTVGPDWTSGTFAPVSPLSALVGEDPVGSWSIFVGDSSGLDPLRLNAFTLNVTAEAAIVPLPAAALLLAGGLFGLGSLRRLRRT